MRRVSLPALMVLVCCTEATQEAAEPEISAREAATAAPSSPSSEPVWLSADPVNLIGRIPLEIRVSSTTPSGRRGPCLMADEDMGSAWNSAAEDEHPWIRFGLPTTSKITALEMTPGYTTPALFAANRRIKRITVFHNGESVAHLDFDVESPTLQRLEFDPPLEEGGSVEVRIDAFETGSNPSWTETCVSEVQLWGVAQTMSGAAPICAVGEPSAEVEPLLARFERLHREAIHSWEPGDTLQRNALLSAIELVAGCSRAAYLRRRLSEVLRQPADEEGRLPDDYSVFFREMAEALRACNLDALREPVAELINLNDDYDPD